MSTDFAAILAQQLSSAGAAPAAAASTTAAATAAPAASNPATTMAALLDKLPAAAPTTPKSVPVSKAIVGNIYSVATKGQPVVIVKFEGLHPAHGAIFTDKTNAPIARPVTGADGELMVEDLTHDEVVRKNFGLPPLAGVTPPDMPAHAVDPLAALAAQAQTSAASTNAAAVTAAVAATPAAEPAAEPAKGKGKGRGKAKAADGSNAPAIDDVILCVNCCPQSGAIDLAPRIAEVAAQLATAAKIPDLRLAPAEHAFAFARWKPALASAFMQKALAPGIYTVRSGDLNDPVIEALAAAADVVIR